ncbi:hypothetical protein [Promicromonospora sp. NPDC023987]|uniref:hypothetical protein n=1 Tax=Promicromonospora sp. NPDC023987 TaxID=3155360 RepID=UPI00340F677F
MFSPRDSHTVLDELGSKFLLALVRATDSARDDLASMRTWNPGWFPYFFQRDVACLVHSRIWAALMSELEGVDGVNLRTEEPFREVRISTVSGRTYTLRIKRHSEDDQIRSYATPTDIAFWGGISATFEGMEEVRLAAGYRWLAASGDVGNPVVSYREGKENPIWAVEIDTGAAGSVTPIEYYPVEPTMPQVDLIQNEQAKDEDTA